MCVQKKPRKKYIKMLEVLLVCIIGVFYSLYSFIVTNFFSKTWYCINSHKETSTVLFPFATTLPSLPHYHASYLHFKFTLNSKGICWSEQDRAERLFSYQSLFVLGFLGWHITKNLASSSLVDWCLLILNPVLPEKEWICAHVCLRVCVCV